MEKSIYGIGIDIVEVKRIQDAWVRLGKHFYEAILTDKELSEVSSSEKQFHYVAKALATKEAFFKALGGKQGSLNFLDVWLYRDHNGKPRVGYGEKVKTILLEKGIFAIHCSISDEREYAVANVLLECWGWSVGG